jgi:hypothetical protein
MTGFQGFKMPSENAARESNRGDHILKPGSGMIKRPSWSKSDPTVIRVFPCIQGNNFQPSRYTENDFSGWFYAASMVLGFGNPQKSWIAYDPEDRHYDTRNNPAVIIYDLVKQVENGKMRGPQEWALMLKGGQGRSALISRPDTALLVRCAIYEYKGQPNTPPDGLAPTHQTVFMLLKKSAWTAMNREINSPSGVTSEDPNLRFKHGDFVSLTEGSFMMFFEMGFVPRGYEAMKPQQPMSSYNSKMKPIGYDCILTKSHRGVPATFNNEEIAMIAKRVATPIRDSLSFPSDEEQVRFIIDSMRDNPASAGLVVHALRDRYERLLPADFVSFGSEFLRQVGLMATTVANPGLQWQPAQQPVPQPMAQPYAYQQPAVPYQVPAVPAPVQQVPQVPELPTYPFPASPAVQGRPPFPVAPTPLQEQVAPLINNMSDLSSIISHSISESSEGAEKIRDDIKEKLRRARQNNNVSGQ